jgi:hypothetical protein
MIIKITSPENGSEQILEIIGINYQQNTNEIKIFNALGNAGVIVTKNTYDAEECIRSIYEKEKTKVVGVLVWGKS